MQFALEFAAASSPQLRAFSLYSSGLLNMSRFGVFYFFPLSGRIATCELQINRSDTDANVGAVWVIL